MHFFFLERFLQPADWFEKRLAYTRSVAASSMVCILVSNCGLVSLKPLWCIFLFYFLFFVLNLLFGCLGASY